MSLIEYLYNTISIIFVVDLMYSTYQINKHYDLVLLYGITGTSRVKLFIERINTVVYIAYIIFKLFIH